MIVLSLPSVIYKVPKLHLLVHSWTYRRCSVVNLNLCEEFSRELALKLDDSESVFHPPSASVFTDYDIKVSKFFASTVHFSISTRMGKLVLKCLCANCDYTSFDCDCVHLIFLDRIFGFIIREQLLRYRGSLKYSNQF